MIAFHLILLVENYMESITSAKKIYKKIYIYKKK